MSDAFWSVTMYGDSNFPVENAIRRHAIGDRDKLKLGDDGSLTLSIQHHSPGAEKESNWLPATGGSVHARHALLLAATGDRLRRVSVASGEAGGVGGSGKVQ